MADMYNRDYADDILRKLKQKIISENPDAVETLEAFATDTAPETEVEEADEALLDMQIEEPSLFDEDSHDDEEEIDDVPSSIPEVVPEVEEEAEEAEAPFIAVTETTFFDQEPQDDQEEVAPLYDAPEEDESALVLVTEAPSFKDGQDDKEEEEADSFEDVPEEKQSDAPIDAFSAEEAEEDYFSTEEVEENPESDREEAESVIFTGEEEQWIADEEELEEDVDFDEDGCSAVTVLAEDEEDNDQEEITEEEADDASDRVPFAEYMDNEEEILPLVLKKNKRKMAEDEASVLVQNKTEETDVLKHPLPKGQKVSPSFFLKRNKSSKPADSEETQNTAITAWRAVLHHTRWTFIGVICMAIITLFLGVLECVSPVKGWIFSFENTEALHKATMLLDSGCLLLCLLLFLPVIIESVKRLSDKVLDGEFICAAVSLLAVVYQAVCALLGKELFLIGFPFAVLLTLSQLSRLLVSLAVKNSAEICLNSHNGTTAVLRRASDLPEVKKALADSPFSHHAIMSTAKFTDTNPFLSRLDKEHVSSRYNTVVAISIGVVGIVAAVFAYLFQSPHAIGQGLAVLAAAFPLSLFVLHNWSYYRLAAELKRANMTVAGAAAVYELANADAVCLRDVDAFPHSNVKITRVMLCDDKRLDRCFVRLRALFEVIGGPLNGLFSVSGYEADCPVSVAVQEITADGISAIVDGESIFVGKGAYMVQKGVRFSYDADDEQLLRNADTPIMFVAIGGVSAAKLYLRYKMSEAFESYVHHLNNVGISVVLRTGDPFITTAMIDRLACLEKGSVGVVRISVGGKTATDALTGGLVGYGTPPKAMYKTRFLFSAYRKMQQSLPWLSLASIPLCGVLCAFSVAAGAISLSLMVVLYQILGVVPTFFIIEAVLRKYQMGDNQHHDK